MLNGVFIIPTGLDCALGGDAAYNPGVKLIASCCDRLVVNPNSVNASDINEIPGNCLYVEGSTIDRFLQGELGLREVKTYNRILMVVNPPATPANWNSMNSGIWGLGANIKMLELNTPVTMKAQLQPDGTAGGTYSGIDELIEQVLPLDFDALAVQTNIDCDPATAQHYWRNGGVNPWGGIEAIVSKEIATRINKPIAHAPYASESGFIGTYERLIVERSMAPEVISNTFTFCILKGLHRSPQLTFDKSGFNVDGIDFLVTPHGCFGRPHKICHARKIPIIVVRENTTCFSNGFTYPVQDGLIFVQNYLEAAGAIMALTAGVDIDTLNLGS